jgi:hypothetical protein
MLEARPLPPGGPRFLRPQSVLVGGSILISGGSALEGNEAALRAILAEWASGQPLAIRQHTLLAAYPLLSAAAAVDDGAIDYLFGDSRQDWFLAHSTDRGFDLNP